MAEVFSLSFGALKERKARSALTILMVVIGTSLIVSLNGMGAGLNELVERQFSTLTPNTLIVIPAKQVERVSAFSPLLPSSAITFNARTVSAILAMEGVRDAVPYIQQPARIVSGGRAITTLVVGFDQSKLRLVFPTATFEEGGAVAPYDALGAVVGSEVARPPREASDFTRVGKIIRIEGQNPEGRDGAVGVKSRSFVVKGVLDYVGSPSIIRIDNSVLVSLNAANQLFDRGGKFDGIIVITDSPALNAHVEEQLRRRFGNNVGIISLEALADSWRNITGSLNSFLLSIAVISLTVAGVGVITTLYTSVTERVREIGLLKALGFTSRHVHALFLSEALVIGLLGATGGVVLGIGLGSFLVSEVFASQFGIAGLRPTFVPRDIALYWVFAVALSVAAGLYPAWKAARVDPVVSLRKE